LGEADRPALEYQLGGKGMSQAVFFIATARSGTQWLAGNLQRRYADLLVTEHEPVGYAYRPKVYLRDEARLDELRALPKVSDHLDKIHRTLDSKSYVEVGFPCYALAPLLVREFGERVRFVHLIRNPVYVAASVATHNWYEPKRQDSLPIDVQPEPSDPGVIQKHYASRWQELSSYEKALFYWTEVHLYGLEVKVRFPDVPFHTMWFENMVTLPSGLEGLAHFLEVPKRTEGEERAGIPIDRHRRKTSVPIDWTEIFRHEQTLELGERFGYDLASINGRDLLTRYQAGVQPHILLRALRKGLRFLRESLKGT